MTPTWRCAHCEVRVSYMPGFDLPDRPADWALVNGELACLACRRELAVEQALAAAGIDAHHVEARAIRRSALSRFELERDPNRGDGVIGRLIGVAGTVVAEVRRELIAAGALSRRSAARPKVSGSKNPGAGLRAEAELRLNPDRSNAEIARALGIAAHTVARARQRVHAETEGT